MNVYDFDETIFHPDSSYSFFIYCLRLHPRAVCHAIPRSLLQLFVYLKEGRKDAKKLKEALFSYLNRMDNVEQCVEDFWDLHMDGIADWYLEQKRDDDLIISASPEFLLKPISDRLGVHLIATPMNPYTGRIQGRNCHDVEKCRRFLECYSPDEIECFYSDSLSDTPMARMASKAFMVHGDEQNPWPEQGK